ncbi:MAG TPA: pentapeptide repeat-containing protein [Candidatus Acidoferrum sp.]
MPGNEAESAEAVPPTVDEQKEASLEKLRLETQVLRQQLSAQFRFLEWLKALTAPIAILAFVWTIATGFDQLREEHVARDREAFDRAVTRLGSDKAGERLTGIVSLEAFLTYKTPSRSWTDLFSALFSSKNTNEDRKSAIVRHLVDATALEPDMAVRSALLDTISRLRRDEIGQTLLDEALRTVVERNRTLLFGWRGRFQNAAEFYDTLTPSHFQLSEAELGRIYATSNAIILLLGQGARTTNLVDIYCVACDFASTRADLSGVHFEKSLLKEANFKGMRLRGSFFDSADLLSSDFTSADLTGAHFTDSWQKNYLAKAFLRYNLVEPPNFSRADLSRATFDENALIGVCYAMAWDEEDKQPPEPMITIPQFGKAILSGTDFSKLSSYAVAKVKTANLFKLRDQLPFRYNGDIMLVAQEGLKVVVKLPVASDVPFSAKSMRHISNALVQSQNWKAAKLPSGWNDSISQILTERPPQSESH